jgi:hypothetical protein
MTFAPQTSDTVNITYLKIDVKNKYGNAFRE